MIRRKDTYFCTMEKWMLFKNTKISYTDSGKGAVVVLLHGFLENKHMWKEIIPVISRNKRVLAIDLLGHGHTECLGYIHPMELMADAVAAVLKTLRIRKITLIGHSMGGYVSLALSEKNPEYFKIMKKVKKIIITAKELKRRKDSIRSIQRVSKKINSLFIEVNIKNRFNFNFIYF